MLRPWRHMARRSACNCTAEDVGERVPDPRNGRGGDVPNLRKAVPEHGNEDTNKNRNLEEARSVD